MNLPLPWWETAAGYGSAEAMAELGRGCAIQGDGDGARQWLSRVYDLNEQLDGLAEALVMEIESRLADIDRQS